MNRAELFRALGALCESPVPEHGRLASALGLEAPGDPVDEAATFLFEVYPYASVYLGEEGMLGGEARARVSGFWRALNLVPPSEPDHLASLLGLLASLIDLEEREDDAALRLARREARRALVHEHLVSWTGPFLRAVEGIGTPHQIAWAAMVRDALAAEATELDLGTAERLPAALREAAAAPQTPAELIACATAPIRTGIVLTRTDVVRGAREIGVGTRMGERAFALRTMAEQDPEGTLAWLGDEARRWLRSHGDLGDGPGVVARWWSSRAAETAQTSGLRAEEVALDAPAG